MQALCISAYRQTGLMAAVPKTPQQPIGNAATAGLLGAYFLVAWWGAEVFGGRVTPTTLVWPASGIGLALVLLRGLGVWPFIFAAGAVRTLLEPDGGTIPVVIASALLNGAASALEPILAAWLIWRLADGIFFRRAGPFMLAMLVAAPIAALVSALPLVAGATALDWIITYSTLAWLALWHSMAVADLMGLLTLAPPVYIWLREGNLPLKGREVVELLVLAGAAALIYTVPAPSQPDYLLLAIHLVIAHRLPLQWSAVAVAISSLVYLWKNTLGMAGLSSAQLYESFLAAVTFVALLNVANYVTALLRAESLEHAERREALLHDRENLLRELGRAEQRERRRIADVLHDHFQQLLAAAKWALGLGDADRARALIDEVTKGMRDLTLELHPPVLDQFGLKAAFDWLSERYRNLHGLEVRVEADESAEPPTPEMRYYLFQAAQGLLMNVVKHANTDTAWLRLQQDESCFELEVEDQGEGCDSAHLDEAAGENLDKYGLSTIRKRVDLLGGRMEMTGENGCRVRITVPQYPAEESSPRGERNV